MQLRSILPTLTHASLCGIILLHWVVTLSYKVKAKPKSVLMLSGFSFALKKEVFFGLLPSRSSGVTCSPKDDSSHKQSPEKEQLRVTNAPKRLSLLSNFHFWFNPSQPITFGQSTRATWFDYLIPSVCVEPRGCQPAQRLRGTPGREHSLLAQLEEDMLRGSNTQEREEAFH